jgi:hypothetical protein
MGVSDLEYFLNLHSDFGSFITNLIGRGITNVKPDTHRCRCIFFFSACVCTSVLYDLIKGTCLHVNECPSLEGGNWLQK